MRCWPRVPGSACGTISACVADQSFRNPEKGKLRRKPFSEKMRLRLTKERTISTKDLKTKRPSHLN
jgi:hypothetical protein